MTQPNSASALHGARDRGAPPADEAFLTAMERGIPPAGGVALGLDRAGYDRCRRVLLR